jgi:2-phosphosulfolactate phosphatase
MTIDAILTPAEIDLLPQRDLQDTTAIVFDVLRATSTIITALAHGAREIYPVRTIEEAFELRSAQMPDALLGGERHGEKIDGFDLGNSPLEYRRELCPRFITTTTNGTIALRACEGAREVLAGALLTISALLAHIEQTACENVLLVCAGTFRDLALEDVIAAGMICASLPAMVELTDAARVARSVFIEHERDIHAALCLSRNGQVLINKGRADEVRWCAQTSFYNVNGVLRAGAIQPL